MSREAGVSDIVKMVEWLKLRSPFEDGGNEWKQSRALRILMRYSVKAFNDVHPAMTAIYCVLNDFDAVEDEVSPYSVGGWRLQMIYDAAWCEGQDTGYKDAKDELADDADSSR